MVGRSRATVRPRCSLYKARTVPRTVKGVISETRSSGRTRGQMQDHQNVPAIVAGAGTRGCLKTNYERKDQNG